MPEGHIRLKGAIEPGVVAEMLQMLSSRTDRVGFLRVANRRVDGRIWYKDGAIVAAECGTERDLVAIRHILRLKVGEFSFVDTNMVPTRSIFDDTTSILLECYRIIDEQKEVEPDEPEGEAAVPATPALDEAEWPMHRPASPRAASVPPRMTSASAGAVHVPVFTPRPATAAAPAEPAVAVSRPAAPWAEESTRPVSGQGLSIHTTPATPATPGAATSATPEGPARPTAGGAAPRPNLPPYRARPPERKKAGRPEWILVTVVCVVILGVCGVLFWRVAESRRHAAGNVPDEAAAEKSAGVWSRFPWFSTAKPRPTPPPLSPGTPAPATPVNWPAIRLSGLVAVPGQVGSAVINGRLVLEGQMIEGVVLDTVTRTGVVLRSGEATRFVSDMTIGSPREGLGSPTNAPSPTALATTNAPSQPAGIRGLLHRWFGW